MPTSLWNGDDPSPLRSKEFWAGVRAEAPLLVGVFPFGIIYGVLALGAGLSRAETQVLSAIIFPELLLPQGRLDLSPGNLRLIAGLLAALAAWRTKNVLVTIVVGMAALLVLQAVAPK